VAGAAPGIALLLLWVTGQRLGISTGRTCARLRCAPYFRRDEITRSHGWRLPFLGRLVLGGLLGGDQRGLATLLGPRMFDASFGWDRQASRVDVRRRAVHRFGTRLAGGLHQWPRRLRDLEPNRAMPSRRPRTDNTC
jgi:hypothetical protein